MVSKHFAGEVEDAWYYGVKRRGGEWWYGW